VVVLVEKDCLVCNQQVKCHPSEVQEDTCKESRNATS
jgi:hypothetical protein